MSRILMVVIALILQIDMQSKKELFSQFGVNLSGGEFGMSTEAYPGTLDYDYTYPSCAEIGYWAEMGIKIIRYQFRLERVMPEGVAQEPDISALKQALDCAQEVEVFLILDMHNYARQIAAGEEVILTPEELAASWSAIVSWTDDQTNEGIANHPALLGYDIMTEPHDMPNDSDWFNLAQTAIDAIVPYDENSIFVIGGDCWGGADTWLSCSGNDRLDELEPTERIVFSGHLYFDRDASGIYDCGSFEDCWGNTGRAIEVVHDRLIPFLEWCQNNQRPCFIGEVGIPYRDPSWQPVLEEAVSLLRQYGYGATLWSAGSWWGDYPLSLEFEEAQWAIDLISKT